MNLFTLAQRNQPGDLAHLGEVVAHAGDNMKLAPVSTGDHGTILFTGSDAAAARAALHGARDRLQRAYRPQANCSDQAGETGKIGRTLADSNVNIDALPSVATCHVKVVSPRRSTPSIKPGQHSPSKSSADPGPGDPAEGFRPPVAVSTSRRRQTRPDGDPRATPTGGAESVHNRRP